MLTKTRLLLASSVLVVILALLSHLIRGGSSRVKSKLAKSVSSQTHSSLRGVPSLEVNMTLDDLYSEEALNTFCARAQNIIAKTKVNAQVALHEARQEFHASYPTPYQGAKDLPLVVPQLFTYDKDIRTGKVYPQGVMCKLKSYDALNDAYPDLRASKGTCSDINLVMFDAVLKGIGDSEPVQVSEVAFDTWPAYSILQWKTPTAFAYRDPTDWDTLRLVAKEMEVPFSIPYPQTPEKKGVQYCQLPTPEYIRKLVLGENRAPVCERYPDNPPNYPYKSPPWLCGSSTSQNSRWQNDYRNYQTMNRRQSEMIGLNLY